MGYGLGVDIGTTWTAAAIARPGSEPQVLSLGGRTAAVPTVVHVLPDRSANVGDAAERRAATDPDRIAREFKRRLGDTTPVLLGGEPWSPETLMATVLRWVLGRATELEGEAPERVVVTHPANWGPLRRELIEQAISQAGVSAGYVTEPEAAAAHYAAATRVPEGAVVAVYDLGGGTFDATVLRKTATGFDVLGKPEGVERLGGLDFDAAVLGHVTDLLGPAWTSLDPGDPTAAAAVQRLRHDCVLAKEALSEDADATIPVHLPTVSTEVRLTRGELESMIRTPIEQSADALDRALASAGVGPEEVDRILLVGGSSRIPLVSQVLTGRFHRPLALDTHPKHAVALGAARLAIGPAVAAPTAVVAPVAPVVAPAPPTPPPTEPVPVATAAAAPVPGPPPSRRFPVWLPVVAVLAVLGVVAALVLGGGGDDEGDDDVGAGAVEVDAGFCDVLAGLSGEVADGNLEDGSGVADASSTLADLADRANGDEQADAVADVQATFAGEGDDPEALVGAVQDELGPFAEACEIDPFAIPPAPDDGGEDPSGSGIELLDGSWSFEGAAEVCEGLDEADCADFQASFTSFIEIGCDGADCQATLASSGPEPLTLEDDGRFVAGGPLVDEDGFQCDGGPDPTRWALEITNVVLDDDGVVVDAFEATVTLSSDDGDADGNSCIAERVVAPGLATPFDDDAGDVGDGGEAFVTVTLEWSSNADLDLVGFDPNGDEVNASAESSTSSTGSHSGDDNSLCGGDDLGFEQVTWSTDAPAGEYSVDVNAFNVDSDGCGSGDYTLTIAVAGQEPAVIQGSVATEETDRETFTAG